MLSHPAPTLATLFGNTPAGATTLIHSPSVPFDPPAPPAPGSPRGCGPALCGFGGVSVDAAISAPRIPTAREERYTATTGTSFIRSSSVPSVPSVDESLPAAPLLDFELPPELEAGEPPEARGLARDQVRLLVSHYSDDRIVHTRFRELPGYLAPGDLLVINTSGTLNAALPAQRADGTVLELHVSTRLPAERWVVELRTPSAGNTTAFFAAAIGETISLPAGASARLLAPYATLSEGRVRLWIASLTLPNERVAYLTRHGFPIRYSYVKAQWPSSYYQTTYATEMGSAEMPSAGRAFTPELITRLVAGGVQVTPLLLHTGVASLEDNEPPYEEYYRVPPATARLVNSARAAGQRVIAVGTTVVRALESAADTRGEVHPAEGWTSLFITPERGLRAVNGLLTGLHEPGATHVAMLAALAGRHHVRLAYAQALRERYYWHEFGDLHLILP